MALGGGGGPLLQNPPPQFLPLPLQLFLFHTVTISSPQNFTQCTTHGSFAQHWHEVAYNMFGFLALFLLPLLVMSACYTRVLLEISRHVSSCNSCECGWLLGGGGKREDCKLFYIEPEFCGRVLKSLNLNGNPQAK